MIVASFISSEVKLSPSHSLPKDNIHTVIYTRSYASISPVFVARQSFLYFLLLPLRKPVSSSSSDLVQVMAEKSMSKHVLNPLAQTFEKAASGLSSNAPEPSSNTSTLFSSEPEVKPSNVASSSNIPLFSNVTLSFQPYDNSSKAFANTESVPEKDDRFSLFPLSPRSRLANAFANVAPGSASNTDPFISRYSDAKTSIAGPSKFRSQFNIDPFTSRHSDAKTSIFRRSRFQVASNTDPCVVHKSGPEHVIAEPSLTRSVGMVSARVSSPKPSKC